MIYQSFAIYKKSIKIIESINHLDHIKPTKRYLNNFFKLYSSPSAKKYGPYDTIFVKDYVGEMYSRLLIKLEEKEKSLNKVT